MSPPSISTILVTRRFRNSRSCDVMTSAPAKSRRKRSSQMIDSMSRWLGGSSRSGASGLGHRVLERVQLGGDLGHLAGAGHRLLDDGPPAHLADVLAEVPDADVLLDGDLPAVGLLFADDEPEDGRLARAVGPDQPHLLPAEDAHRRLQEEDLVAVLLGDGVEANHEVVPTTTYCSVSPASTTRASRPPPSSSRTTSSGAIRCSGGGPRCASRRKSTTTTCPNGRSAALRRAV